MNFSTRHYVMIAFAVLNLVNQGSAYDPSEVPCAWGFSSTGHSVCNDGKYQYVYENAQCHRPHPNQPTVGVDCKAGSDGQVPPPGVTCDYYSLKYFKDWHRIYIDCTNVSSDPSQSSIDYHCGSMDNIPHCYGAYVSRDPLPKIIP
ncbi:uncharacterized protein MELLADRAFT_123742 [Melampsora larici-populina 98AG31]|uniref:Secreted protein n=1 Tax=Melampsora larici-populina (strain 98AG31 / pathotype 3-4-7) TaxID=747676 RepID=F4S636_MELLP|nr:uncharacterized protein MELLADRAFT_123742 [Melampsora larici-populina 98AG31]EGF99911.1 secreted protein [Melampsora larici-populina 98AG31]